MENFSQIKLIFHCFSLLRKPVFVKICFPGKKCGWVCQVQAPCNLSSPPPFLMSACSHFIVLFKNLIKIQVMPVLQILIVP